MKNAVGAVKGALRAPEVPVWSSRELSAPAGVNKHMYCLVVFRVFRWVPHDPGVHADSPGPVFTDTADKQSVAQYVAFFI